VQLIEKALKPKAKTDLEIFLWLAKRFGFRKWFFYSSPEDVFREIRKVVPQYSAITYSKLRKRGIQWPCDKDNPWGTKILYREKLAKQFTFYPLALKHFKKPRYYPFALISCRSLIHFNSRAMTRNVKKLEMLEPENWLELNPKDARRLGIREGEEVKVISRQGEIRVKARISKDVPQKVVVLRNHYSRANPNKLTPPIFDPLSKIPGLKWCWVRVEKIKKKVA
jgi:predicted molibdopterin-dependent oxidoreductase YjgC